MNFDFTICIPTFNRGKRALDLVNELLKNIEKNWCILVLDNASINGVDYYKKIESLSKINKQLDYIKHDFNKLFHGNYLSCFNYSKSKYIMILSDEDFVNFSETKFILNDIKEKENLGVCRGSIQIGKDLSSAKTYASFTNSYFHSGENSMKNFCFVNNYISGIIYNLDLIKSYNLMDIFTKNIGKHATYPHIYFELLISSKCDVMTTSKILSFQGIPEKTINDKGEEGFTSENVDLVGYGARISQFLTLRDGIVDAVNLLNKNEHDSFIIFLELYLLLVNKYFYLIAKCNMQSYKNNYLEESLLIESFFYITTSAIFSYPQITPFKDVILDSLTKIYASYKN